MVFRFMASVLAIVVLSMTSVSVLAGPEARPNFLFIFIDDQRPDTFGHLGNDFALTPNLDAIARQSLRFEQGTVVLAICSPARATALTGLYPATVGVTTYGNSSMPDVPTFPALMAEAGYLTAVNGKWHLGNRPEDVGFQWADTFEANGAWYGRKVVEQGIEKKAEQYIEEWIADRSIALMEKAKAEGKPFVLWHSTQVPHLNGILEWPIRDDTRAKFDIDRTPLPSTWDHDHSGKPPYLMKARSYTLARKKYSYGTEAGLRRHIQEYYGAVHEMDAQIGRVTAKLDELGLAENTYVIVQGDNGWLLGEYGLTSKVLAYEPSMRVPMSISGPGVEPGASQALVANIDIMPTLLDLAGITVPGGVHGKTLTPLLNDPNQPWRDVVYYESPTPQLIPRPFCAVRGSRYKLIETYNKAGDELEFLELYDFVADPEEKHNLADHPDHTDRVAELRARLAELKAQYTAQP